MLQKKNIDRLRFHLQRLFALKIGRTTFREMQNAILASVDGDRDEAGKLFEALLRGEVADDAADKESIGPFRTILDAYCIPCRLARDVYERGEYIQVITSDTLRQDNQPLFINRIRRIDGEEIQFLSDIESSLHLIQHFVGRLHDAEREGGESKTLEKIKKELASLKTGVDQMLVKLAKPQA
ncbi:MAG: DUF5414 family protein [Chlamydiales bacterium]|nr:DUF5414 family protein [Chlamydiales bacterium]